MTTKQRLEVLRVVDSGRYGCYVQRYVGHAPTTIGERHYHGDQGKRLIVHFRTKVVAHVEEAIAAWKPPPDTRILPKGVAKTAALADPPEPSRLHEMHELPDSGQGALPCSLYRRN